MGEDGSGLHRHPPAGVPGRHRLTKVESVRAPCCSFGSAGCFHRRISSRVARYQRRCVGVPIGKDQNAVGKGQLLETWLPAQVEASWSRMGKFPGNAPDARTRPKNVCAAFIAQQQGVSLSTLSKRFQITSVTYGWLSPISPSERLTRRSSRSSPAWMCNRGLNG